MSPLRCLPLAAILACSTALGARAPEVTDPDQACKDPDFAIQGEYLGEGTWADGTKTAVGAQVIAQGDGKFRVVLDKGGLPGDGWKRGDPRLFLDGRRKDAAAELSGKEYPKGQIADGKLVLKSADGKVQATLERIERKSPTLGEKPPAGAVVLFDGTTAEHFTDGKLTDMKTLEAGCTSKENYPMRRLHLEFRLSWKPDARGQGRSNSGVYIGGLPEIQVLDSFGLEGAKNECGAFYGRREPDVNMCFPPVVWQTYDVEFSEPKKGPDGKPTENIRATVRHNGVIVHKDFDTGKKDAGPRRLHLQAHGNHVQYRNIWLLP